MKKLLLGDFAVARGAYEAGVKVAAAYPGTPSTEITEELARYKEVHAEWSPNEKVAAEVGIGASIAGARAIVSMKHVGFNVAADPFFTAAYSGVNAGLVIAVADDPAMHSSQNEQDTRNLAEAAKITVLEPYDSEEAKEYTKAAFDLSEKYDTPVIVRLTTRVAHSQSVVTIGERVEVPVKPYVKDAAKYVMMPGNARKRRIVLEERMAKITQDAETFRFNKTEMRGRDLGIICSGAVYGYVRESFPEASILKLGMVYPLPLQMIKEFSQKVKTLLAVEELDPFIENGIKAAGIKCEGKKYFPTIGEFSVNLLKEKYLNIKPQVTLPPVPLPMRPPVLCAGCPHRNVFYVLNKLKTRVFGDIGCYTLGALPPLNATDAVICMGASIGMAHGAEKADGGKNTVAVIGDSTFIHSGITGLINAVYNKSNITVLILDNSTTGMTGHQEHPGTGKTIKSEPAHALNLAQLSRSCGATNVVEINPDDIDLIEKTVKEETVKSGVSVIIIKKPCALLTKKLYKGFVVNGKCKKCKLCMRIGCPAISFGTASQIDKTLCTECGLCKKMCKFGAIDQ